MVRPPSIVTHFPAPQEEDEDEDEIVSPQPQAPKHKVLKLKTQDDLEISPIMTPPLGGNSHFHYTVSPLSPDGSVRSFDAVSEPDRLSYLRSKSCPREEDTAESTGRCPSRTDSTQDQTALGFRPLTIQTQSLQPNNPGHGHGHSQKSVFEHDDVERKLNRRMSSQISGFAKSLLPAPSHRIDGSSSGSRLPETTRKADESSKASPVPIVKNILSKAKSGLKIGSDEAKKEKKRENMKRQIKVETLE